MVNLWRSRELISNFRFCFKMWFFYFTHCALKITIHYFLVCWRMTLIPHKTMAMISSSWNIFKKSIIAVYHLESFFPIWYIMFYFIFLLLFKYSCFPATMLPHLHLPPSILPPSAYGSFIHGPWQLFPFFPLWSPSPSPLVTVSSFFISISLFIFCLLVCFVD